MPRSYATEFPDFTVADIPVEFLDASQWVDISWHNEASPRFISHDTLTRNGMTARVCIWVERVNVEDREDPSFPRFCVELVTPEELDSVSIGIDCDTLTQVWVAIAHLGGPNFASASPR